ncbi:SGNH/GDSL hydrolase family protein [Isoptericola sp. NEAU-Y5]|uniref:SGNH/GDSL hydrolase family protein n=1 Tax=Isoptericola luteus TaxID=2879484 RepID=A0ABS7ZEZ9_9MICO|nr:SGNH/GDSL hydrolase family protein [Isoptericola sp. NEAU-Y5]MCA5893037.1 SGNH/GDSL hydrolase family protein [Isoptericola sp. NEAU-Y5]
MTTTETSPTPSEPTTPRWTRYVAVGDSFTEGLWDPYPFDDGTPAPAGTESTAKQRGWADRLADELSARRAAGGERQLEYANLAIRGRLVRHILAEQVDVALEAEPDLVSLVGGGNDILRPQADIDMISAQLEQAVAKIRATGADVLLGTGFRAGGALSFTRGRTGQYNANIWSIARRHGAHVLDLWGMDSLFDLRVWSDDRIHLTPEGHRRVADAALVGLGLEPVDPDFDGVLDPLPPTDLVARARANAQWARTHVVPWVQRRIKHTSSGDGRQPKWPAPGTSWPPTD